MKQKIKTTARKPKGQGGNNLFNMGMGASATQGSLSRFKNKQSTNDLKSYNPFKTMLDETGADNF